MKNHCHNPNNPRYDDWGGRGIRVCQEWLDSYQAFKEWALSHGWSPELQINRINNDGNYEPGNCNFVTPSENSRNRRSNVLITDQNGVTKTMIEWSEELGISYWTIKSRWFRGLPPEKLLEPELPHNIKPFTQYVTYDGITLPLKEWAKYTDCNYKTLQGRYYSGWSDEDIIEVPKGMTRRMYHYHY
jgi:hypothetical protein